MARPFDSTDSPLMRQQPFSQFGGTATRDTGIQMPKDGAQPSDPVSMLMQYLSDPAMGPLIMQMLSGSNRPPSPYGPAIQAAQKQYPLLNSVPLAVTTGTGPYESEVYQPWNKENPDPGRFTVQLRSQAAKSQTGQNLQDTISAESLHNLGALKPDGTPVNPAWFALKQQFEKTLTPRDMALAHQHWQEEQKNASPEDRRSFDAFMNEAYLDMFFRGYLFPKNQGQEWVDRMQGGRWTPQERGVLGQMRSMLLGPNAQPAGPGY